jgi:uncharacterized membrane protein
VTFGIKSMSLLGMLSSLFGLGLIWKWLYILTILAILILIVFKKKYHQLSKL